MSQDKSGVGENGDGYVLAVGIALLIASILLVGYYVTMTPPSNSTMTLYVLDSGGGASNYPDLLIINQNNTFNVQVWVEDHMGGKNATECQLLMKIVNGTPFSYPLNITPSATYPSEDAWHQMHDGDKWLTDVSATISEPGTYSVVFELYTDGQFSGYYCVLNIKVAL